MSEYAQDELPLGDPVGTDLSAKHYVDKAKTEAFMKPVTDQELNNAAVIADRAAQLLAAAPAAPPAPSSIMDDVTASPERNVFEAPVMPWSRPE